MGPLNERPCSQFDKFSYVTATGPAKIPNTEQEIKLVFLLINSQLQIRENNEVSLFQMLSLFVTNSDNYLKASFENFLSQIVQSGIDLLQTRYIQEYTIKIYLKSLVANNFSLFESDHMSQNLMSYALLWWQNGCFSFYSRDKCDLSLNEVLEKPVKIVDFFCVWVLLIVLLNVSVVVYTLEHIKNGFCH